MRGQSLSHSVAFCMELHADQIRELIAALEAAHLWPEIVEELRGDLAHLEEKRR